MANKPKNNNNAAKSSDKKTSDNRARARRMAAAQQNRQKKESTLDYWKGVRQEMKKVVWPTRQELGLYTVVVIFTCAVFALGFWAIDSGFLAILRAVLGITLS